MKRTPVFGGLVRTIAMSMVLVAALNCSGQDIPNSTAEDTPIFFADLKVDPCTPATCSGNGYCADGVCDCNEGFAGAHCNKCGEGFAGFPDCADDPCEPDPCLGNGFCDSGTCHCNEGYAGDHCNQCADGFAGYPDCVSEQCQPSCEGKVCGPDGCGGECGGCPEELFCNDGECAASCTSDPGCLAAGMLQCQEDGTAFATCEVVAPDCFKWGSDLSTCPEAKACLVDECVDDPCFGVDCSGFGDCVVQEDSLACACDIGYVPQNLECVSAYNEPQEQGVLGGQEDCTQLFWYPFSSEKAISDTYAGHIAGGRPGGTDFSAGIGTPLFSPVYGTIEGVFKDSPDGPSVLGPNSEGGWQCNGSGYGNFVKIRIQAGEYVLLAHMKQGSIQSEMGDVVVPGQKVGEIGNSGYVCSKGGTGAHLHLGYNKSGWVDPTVCFITPFQFGSSAITGIACYDGDLDTYGVGDGCWKVDCDDSELTHQSFDASGCKCLAETSDGIQCKDRDLDGYESGKNCPFFDRDCDDYDPSVHDQCSVSCGAPSCPSNCSGHGTCNEQSGLCSCVAGFAGAACSQCAQGYVNYPSCQQDSCNPDPCNGHGSCNNGSCSCSQGYSGTWCNQCAQGYTGYPNCQVDSCAGDPCNGHGSCNNGNCTCYQGYGGIWCNQCAQGYVGYPNCQIDSCAGDPCNGHGSCNNGNCSCYQGYGGTWCNQCASGYVGYPNCQDDPCQPNPCNGHGSCSNGSCSCYQGYSGTWCSQCGSGYIGYPNCKDDPCSPDPCNGHGSCSNGSCSCSQGYSGSTCNKCASGYSGYPNCEKPKVCPSGNGLYCGGSVGLDSKTLYNCSGGNYTPSKLCGAGCQVNAPGVNDSCKSCPSGNGLYCGGPFGLSSKVLYNCTSGNFTISKTCPGSCHVAAPGQNDYCN